MKYSQKQGREPFKLPAPLLIMYRQSGENGWRRTGGRCKCHAGRRIGIRADVRNKTDI